LYKRIEALYADEMSDEQLREKFNLDKWDIKKARIKLRNLEDWKAPFSKCLYRPFDRRDCYFSDAVMDRPRRELINHVAGKDNLVLNLPRIVKLEEWQHALISNLPCVAVSVDVNGSYAFPLYLYPTKKEATLFDLEETPNTPGDRRPNLSDEFISDFAIKLGINFIPDGKGDRVKTFAPEDVFAYMYAIFHSPTYRQRYAEFLKTDFPRLPLTSKPELFKQLCDLGERLIELHLMQKHGEDITTYPIEGENIVDKVSYSEPKQDELGKVWINKTQYFEGVPQQVWDFYIGGYQVCDKWLKDRKGRTLRYEDLMHYKNIVSAISETINLIENIDQTINKFGGFPIM
ncbi:MAG: hypothetical protein RLZZ574_2448, partial [Cyanobacteriota bacterium]